MSDPIDLEIAKLARQIAEPVEPLVYQVHPTDEDEGAWWVVEPYEDLLRPPQRAGSDWDYLAGRARDEGAWGALAERPVELPSSWWDGCLAGFRMGLDLAKLPDPVADLPRPVIPGRRTR